MLLEQIQSQSLHVQAGMHRKPHIWGCLLCTSKHTCEQSQSSPGNMASTAAL